MESSEERAGVTEPDERSLALARDIFKTFTKTLKTLNVYPRQNPIAQKFIAELFEKMDGFFADHELLDVEVSQFSMSYMGQEVFFSEDRQDNLALSLFIDGIRGFAFLRGISRDEIEIFIDILKTASRGENSEDDVVTLLWEKELEHVRYFVPEQLGEEETDLQERFISSGQQTPQVAGQGIQGEYSELTIIPAGMEMDVQPISDEEMRDLRAELSAINPAALLKTIAGMFFELMQTETELSSYGNYVKGLFSIMELWEDHGNTADFLYFGKKTADFFGRADNEKRELLARLIDKLTGIEDIRWFMSASRDAGERQEYLAWVAGQSTGNLVLFLGDVEDRKARHMICGLLAAEAARDIAPFVRFLTDERWFLVRNIIMLLGQSKNPAAVKPIEGMLAHSEARVRKECMKALDMIGAPEAKGPLMKLLEDRDSAIRTGALKALKKYGGEDLLSYVTSAVQADGFTKRTFSEKREFLEVLGSLGKEQAFPLLRGFFRKRGFFKKDQIIELRAAAAYGLAFVQDEEAFKMLKKGARSRKSLVREACLNSLKSSGVAAQ
ncbi:MAG: HEAT repeat domain-containing protein [Nitrospiraceae bacterium]|nr:HEAT repeat domain-containing protein [Nitrospiraceae bacterium]